MVKRGNVFVIHHGNDNYQVDNVGQAIEKSWKLRYLWRECLEDECQISSDVGPSTVLNFVRCLRGEKVDIEEGLMEFGAEWECPPLIESQVDSLGSLSRAICCLESIGETSEALEAKGVSMLEGSEVLELGGCPFVVFTRMVSRAKVSVGRRFEILKGAVLEFGMWVSEAVLEGMKWEEVEQKDLEWLESVGGHFGILARGLLAGQAAESESQRQICEMLKQMKQLIEEVEKKGKQIDKLRNEIHDLLPYSESLFVSKQVRFN